MANELTSQIHSKDGALGLLGLGGLRGRVENRTGEEKSQFTSQQPVMKGEKKADCRKVTKERQKIGFFRLKDTKNCWIGQGLPDSLVKDALEIPLRQSRALNVLVDNLVRLVDILDVVQNALVSDRLHVLLGQGSAGARVISKIDLGADQDDGGSGGVVSDLREPLSKESQMLVFLLPKQRLFRGECASYLCINVVV